MRISTFIVGFIFCFGHLHSQDKATVNNLGKYYAIIIGASNYVDPGIPDLDSLPIKDALALREVLAAHYLFEKENTLLLLNPTRRDIVIAFSEMATKITPKDNLLIFYAGHGHYETENEIGYWFPCDAEAGNPSNWLYNDQLVVDIKKIKSLHTLLISDACFSGSIFKTRSALDDVSELVKQKYELKSRKAITSGTLKTVPNKSVFVKYLLEKLYSNNTKYFSASQLFHSIEEPVSNNSGTLPQFGVIQNVGDEGGDFIFVARGALESFTNAIGLAGGVIMATKSAQSMAFEVAAENERKLKEEMAKAEKYFEEGEKKRKNQLFIAAINEYNEAIKLLATKGAYYRMRGRCYNQTGNKTATLNDYNKSIELAPYDHLGWADRGSYYLSAGEYEKGVVDYTKVIELAPADPSGFQYRAACLMGLKKYQQALIDYQSAIQFAPTEGWLYAERARAKLNLKDYEGCIADANKALEKVKDKLQRANALQIKAAALLKTKNFSQALSTYQELEKITNEIAPGSKDLPELKIDLKQGLAEIYKRSCESAIGDGDIKGMEQYYSAYRARASDDRDIEELKQKICSVYYDSALYMMQMPDANDLILAKKYFLNAKDSCNHSGVTDELIKKCDKKIAKYLRPNRVFLAYCYDYKCPIGIAFGGIRNRSTGFYASFRCNSDAFTESDGDFKNEDFSKSGKDSISSAGSTRIANKEALIGLTQALAYPIWLYLGAGIGAYPVYENIEKFFSGKSQGKFWMKNTDQSSLKPIFEVGIIVDYKGLNLRSGVKANSLNNFILTFGIGFSF